MMWSISGSLVSDFVVGDIYVTEDPHKENLDARIVEFVE